MKNCEKKTERNFFLNQKSNQTNRLKNLIILPKKITL